MIFRRSIRGVVLAAVAAALIVTSAWAGVELGHPAHLLLAQALNRGLAAARPTERAQASHGELKTRIPAAKQFCTAPVNVGFSHHLPATGFRSQRLSRVLLIRGRDFDQGRAPPAV